MKKIALARFKYTPYGGAENYLARLISAMKDQGIPLRVFSTNWVDSDAPRITSPKFMPSFIRILSFAYFACKQKKSDEGDLRATLPIANRFFRSPPQEAFFFSKACDTSKKKISP